MRRTTVKVGRDLQQTAAVDVCNCILDALFRLSVGQLPGWAQRQIHARPSIAQSFSTSSLEKAGVEGVEEGVQGGEVEGCWADVSTHHHLVKTFT